MLLIFLELRVVLDLLILVVGGILMLHPLLLRLLLILIIFILHIITIPLQLIPHLLPLPRPFFTNLIPRQHRILLGQLQHTCLTRLLLLLHLLLFQLLYPLLPLPKQFRLVFLHLLDDLQREGFIAFPGVAKDL